MTHYDRLIAAGIDPDMAARDAWADDVGKLEIQLGGYQTREEYAAGEREQEPITNYADRRGV